MFCLIPPQGPNQSGVWGSAWGLDHAAYPKPCPGRRRGVLQRAVWVNRFLFRLRFSSSQCLDPVTAFGQVQRSHQIAQLRH